jgi:hypothetical protein
MGAGSNGQGSSGGNGGKGGNPQGNKPSGSGAQNTTTRKVQLLHRLQRRTRARRNAEVHRKRIRRNACHLQLNRRLARRRSPRSLQLNAQNFCNEIVDQASPHVVYDLTAKIAPKCAGLASLQISPSFILPASLIMCWFHGGSHTNSTSASSTPGMVKILDLAS